MKILIMGGTYFLGKAFTELCDQEGAEITMFNRGTREVSYNEDGHICVITGDRHDPEGLKKLAGKRFDAVVDFCAYEKGDIESVMDAIDSGCSQYLFISTCDVYQRGTGRIATESTPFEERDFGGQEGAYICGKVALEKELSAQAKKRGIHYTSIRPAFIYGQDNYAPREGIYFHWMKMAGQILLPDNGGGDFQMVYVKDLAYGILKCIANPDVYDGAVTFSGTGILSYEEFADALEAAAGQKIERIYLPVEDILEKQIPLPFPLTQEESERYEDSAVQKLGITYTPLQEGIRRTYAWYLQEA